MSGGGNKRERSQAADHIAEVLHSAQDIPHTDYVVGRGIRKTDGGVAITEYRVSGGLGDAFVNAYPEFESFDSASQQFLCFPFLPIAIEVGGTCYVDDKSKQSNQMNDYLGGFGVNSLLVVGLESSMGLCWMTLYRRHQPSNPFSADNAELASYRIRAALYEWQRKVQGSAPLLTPPLAERYQLLPVGRRCLDVAVRRMRGISRKDIAIELGMKPNAVDGHVKRLNELNLGARELMDRLLGKLPPARPLPANDPERATKEA